MPRVKRRAPARKQKRAEKSGEDRGCNPGEPALHRRLRAGPVVLRGPASLTASKPSEAGRRHPSTRSPGSQIEPHANARRGEGFTAAVQTPDNGLRPAFPAALRQGDDTPAVGAGDAIVLRREASGYSNAGWLSSRSITTRTLKRIDLMARSGQTQPTLRRLAVPAGFVALLMVTAALLIASFTGGHRHLTTAAASPSPATPKTRIASAPAPRTAGHLVRNARPQPDWRRRRGRSRSSSTTRSATRRPASLRGPHVSRRGFAARCAGLHSPGTRRSRSMRS